MLAGSSEADEPRRNVQGESLDHIDIGAAILSTSFPLGAMSTFVAGSDYIPKVEIHRPLMKQQSSKVSFKDVHGSRAYIRVQVKLGQVSNFTSD